MAIILRGKTCCALCQTVLGDRDDIVATSHFIKDSSHPLWRFSDATMHRTCFLNWPLRQEFVDLYNATLAPYTFSDGTCHVLQDDGTLLTPHRSQEGGLKPGIVLVIDDHFSEVEGLLYALSQHGIQAMYARSGVQGLEKARETLPHLILCDLRMPGMTGYEFLEAVNLDSALCQTAVILLDADWVVDRDALNAWSKPTPSGRTADMHWFKPIDVDEYVASIRNILSHME